jgi:spermidine synthase
MLILLFVGSGCAALIYEIVWFQLLSLIIGSSAVSMGVLLGTFMGGMCIGSLFLSRYVSSRQHPLRVYAYLELAIAAFGLLVLWGLPYVGGLYFAFALARHGGPASSRTLLRHLSAAAHDPDGRDAAGDRALGSDHARGRVVAGLLLRRQHRRCGARLRARRFYLLRDHDMAFATYVAVVIDVAVAAAGLALAKSTFYHGAEEPETSQSTEPMVPKGAWPVLITIGISGATALAAEAVWTRLLSLLSARRRTPSRSFSPRSCSASAPAAAPVRHSRAT